MTTPCNNSKLTEQLWGNSQISKVEFNGRDFSPTNKGHGLFVKTMGQDVLIDLRFSRERPFWGHSHPLVSQHHYGNLKNKLLLNNYSVPKTEFIRMLETFQKVDIQDIFSSDFKITYHNIVITISESVLEDFNEGIKTKVTSLIKENPDTYFWIVEKDINLLAENGIFYLQDLLSDVEISKHTHFCFDTHFISSIYIYSHHLFSEDENIQLFLGAKNLLENIISNEVEGKNFIDFNIIDEYLKKEMPSFPIQRIGRYLFLKKEISKSEFNEHGIIISEDQTTKDLTILAIPLSCTNAELLDTLSRIKLTIQ